MISSSASEGSANERVIAHLCKPLEKDFRFTLFSALKTLPHFDRELSVSNPPETIIAFRKSIEQADAVIICTPEYVFSIPSGWKNAIEWCVATTVFSDKPIGLITASAHGQKGHEELKLIIQTIGAKFTNATTLLIQGVKGKIDADGAITDTQTLDELLQFSNAFKDLLNEHIANA